MEFDPHQAAGRWQRSAILAPGSAMAVDTRHIDRIRCDRGTLWLTRDGDPADLILEPGQVAQFPPGAGESLVTNLHRNEAVGLTLLSRPGAAPGRCESGHGRAVLLQLLGVWRGLTRALDFGSARARTGAWLAP